MSAPILDLAEGTQWSDPGDELEEAVSRGLMEGHRGIAISAPSSVPLATRGTVPLWGLRLCSYREAIEQPLHAALLVASCVETGELKMGSVVDRPDSAGDGEDPGEGATGTTFQLDLIERLRIPAKPGTWIVRVLLYGEQSNVLRVELKRAPARFQDPAALALIRELANKPVVRALHPRPALGAGLPSYEAAPENPPVPEQPGIVLKIPRAIFFEGPAPLVVRGSFRARILQRDIRPPPTEQTAKMRGPRATAVLPLTLLAISSESLNPRVMSLVIPTYAELQGDGEEKVGTGSFAIDLNTLAPLEEKAQTIFFYALGGEQLSAAAPCAVVTRDQVPG